MAKYISGSIALAMIFVATGLAETSMVMSAVVAGVSLLLSLPMVVSEHRKDMENGDTIRR